MNPDAPMALATLHRDLEVDDVSDVTLVDTTDDDQRCHDVVLGAGFALVAASPGPDTDPPTVRLRLRRLRSLPDTVGPDMALLVCGLNPSLHSADLGVGFGRAGNRFWPAALAAGIVSVDRDAHHALVHHGVGMTDLVKRATPRADELTADEYRAGLERLDRLCAWLRPDAVCMVGLAGWRVAVDRRATAGWQTRRLGTTPVYVMPSTSGLNAHSRLADLTEHLRQAAAPPPIR